MQFNGDELVFDYLANSTKKQQVKRLEYIEKLYENIKIHSAGVFGRNLKDEGIEDFESGRNNHTEIYSIPKFKKNSVVVLDQHITFFGLLEEKIISFESVYTVLYESFYDYYIGVINPDGQMERCWSIEANEQIPGDFLRNFRVVMHLIFVRLAEEDYFICVENLEKYYLSHLLTSIKLVNDTIMDYPNIICKEKDYRHILGIPNFSKSVQRIRTEAETIDENLILFYIQSINKIFKDADVDFKSLYEVISTNISEIKKSLTFDSLISREIDFEVQEFYNWYIRNQTNPKHLYEKNQELLYKEQLNILSDNKIFVGPNGTGKLVEEIEDIKKTIELRNLDKIWWHEDTVTKASFINFYKENYKKDLIDIIFKDEVHQKLIYKDLKKRLINLDELLNERVFGQEQAFHPIISVIKRWFVGIKSKNKPIGSFMFVGNTGIGKTETAKVLSDLLFDGKMITVDMSEFQHSIDVGKIIGVAPGYVGYEEGGGLLEKIKETPRCVLLFDEIEKAHPRIYDIFLQMLDEGRLTDNKGIEVSFEETLILFTTNYKAQEINEMRLKFQQSDTRADLIRVLGSDGVLRKEFLNRFTDIIHYRDLEYSSLVKIFDSKLDKIAKHLKDINITLSFGKLEDSFNNLVEILLNKEDKAKEIREFVLKGIDRSLGARELDRIINSDILDKIINIYVEEELKEDNSNKKEKVATISLSNNKLEFSLNLKEKDHKNEQ